MIQSADTPGVPPCNEDAERSTLGSMLLDQTGETVDIAASICEEGDFYSPARAAAFRHLLSMRQAGKPPDPILLAERLLESKLFDTGQDTRYFVDQLYQSVPHHLHIRHYCRVVKEASDRRRLIHAARDAVTNAFQPSCDISQIVGQLDQQLRSIEERSEAGPIDVTSILNELQDRWKTGNVPALPTRFPDIDRLLDGGLTPGQLIIIAARPSLGKTALVGNVSLNVAKHQEAVLFFSLEQSRSELAERMLSSLSGISLADVKSGRRPLIDAQNQLASWPILIDDRPRLTLQQIAATARLYRRRRNVRLVVIDYLQLIKADDPRTVREQQVAAMSRCLKCLARELEIPVIVLAQLNRQLETRDNKRPRLSDLRESGAIEQDADIVMFLHRPEAYNPQDRPGEADLIVAKNRNGKTGQVPLIWHSPTVTFRSAAQ